MMGMMILIAMMRMMIKVPMMVMMVMMMLMIMRDMMMWRVDLCRLCCVELFQNVRCLNRFAFLYCCFVLFGFALLYVCLAPLCFAVLRFASPRFFLLFFVSHEEHHKIRLQHAATQT